jgi:putative flippase GtrA
MRLRTTHRDAIRALMNSAQLRRYALVGIASAALHLAILAYLIERLGMSPPLASSIGFVVVALAGFVAQHRWVYRSGSPMRQTAPRFLIVAVVAFLVNGLTVHLGTTRLEAHYGLVQIIAFVLIPVSNYVLHTLWSFAIHKPST